VAEVGMGARYSPCATEQRVMQRWLDGSAFQARLDAGSDSYSMVIPPPNVTGSLHMGHALNGTIQDLLIRYHKMRGQNTLWVVGTDHAGIATQNKVEGQLAEEGLSRQEIGRDAFEQRVWMWREKYGSTIIRQLTRLGCACDYDNERFTMDDRYHEAVIKVFVDLYEKGDIFRDYYLVNWCPRCESALSDLEVEHADSTDALYYVHYPLVGGDTHLTVATTRPETILADTAVAVNPRDERFSRYVGSKVVVPLVGREVPVVADEHVDPEFGTGTLKITPGHDPNDWDIGRRHGLEVRAVVGFDGRMNEEAGEFQGMSVDEARKAVVKQLDAAGRLERSVEYVHSVGSCYRCGTVIEPLPSLQWFMNMQRVAEPAIKCVQDGRVRFVPERWTDVYLDWMRNIRPWCLSRQLWWGHRLPVWYCESCEGVVVTELAPDLCPDCGGELRQDEDVLDTWFSSALWPFVTLGWPKETKELDSFYPTSVLSTARDIIFLWVSRMIMMGLEYAGDIPFEDVIIHPTILAPDGRRMSKSLGTGVDPLDLIDEYGADATRFGLCYMSSVQDVRFSSERIEMGRNFANKIWNASRLALQGAPETAVARVSLSTPADRWIFSRLDTVVEEVGELYEKYEFAEAARALYRFSWNEMCDWYLEIAKSRLYGEDEEARREVAGNLLLLIEEVMALLHPMMPFVTQEIYSHLPQVVDGSVAADLLKRSFPESGRYPREQGAEASMAAFIDVVGGLRSTRDELGVARNEAGRVYLLQEEEGRAEALQSQADSFRQLSGCVLESVVFSLGDVPTERHASVDGHGVRAFLDLTGLVDVDKERDRLLTKIKKIRVDLKRSRGKLDSAGFLENAPKEVVQQERDRLERSEMTLDELAGQYRERVGEELPS